MFQLTIYQYFLGAMWTLCGHFRVHKFKLHGGQVLQGCSLELEEFLCLLKVGPMKISTAMSGSRIKLI